MEYDYKPLMKFYQANSEPELIEQMEAHISKLQSKLAALSKQQPVNFVSTNVREG